MIEKESWIFRNFAIEFSKNAPVREKVKRKSGIAKLRIAKWFSPKFAPIYTPITNRLQAIHRWHAHYIPSTSPLHPYDIPITSLLHPLVLPITSLWHPYDMPITSINS